MHKVLLADDELTVLQDKSIIIESMGYKCYTASNGYEAINLILKERPDIVLTDMRMPGEDGFDVLREALKSNPTTPVIVFTESGTIQLAVKAMKEGAFDFLEKPLFNGTLRKAIERALQKKSNGNGTYDEISQKPEKCTLRNFIGASKIMQELIARICKAAKSESNIFIYGESGTGKELIAINIHELNSRNNNPFVVLDCTSFPPSLMESEIFGFEKGSFTSAIALKPGLIDLANTGILFLDEITVLDANLQSKLLRLLQERRFRKIGSNK